VNSESLSLSGEKNTIESRKYKGTQRKKLLNNWLKEFEVNLKYVYEIQPFYKKYKENYYNDRIMYFCN